MENTYIVVGNENAPATVKNSLVDLKNRSTIGPLIFISSYISKRNENRCSNKNLYINIHQNRVTIDKIGNRSMSEQTVAYTKQYNVIHQ